MQYSVLIADRRSDESTPRPRQGRRSASAAARAWTSIASVAVALAALFGSGSASAQADAPPTQLTGTLAKIRQSGQVVIGHRDSSIPFSYVSATGEPIGYSIDLCKQLVDAISEEVGKTIAIKWQLVTSESRIPAVASGQVDLECGSTTNNIERQKLVSFSPTMFVSGTKVMVKTGSPIRTFRDLAGKRVAVTAGTTNEKTLRDLSAKFDLKIDLKVAPDHAASFALLTSGAVDAFATDDVLLYGLLAQNKAQADYVVAGDFLSYDPYGVMFRKDDAQMARLVNDTFHRLAEDREIDRRYDRWFLRRLPASGMTLNLPMSPQLETIIQTMVARTE
ncbi:MAG: extracellular solute-binding protein family 3 [Rhizobacter sp.]|nr:extracellular solute-binding protein family 3 [Rhizobacter sp.]